MAKRKYTAQEVARAIYEAKGFLTIAAKRLGCSYQTVLNYIERYATCREARDAVREEMKDLAEGKLFEQIQQGNLGAIKYYLSNQAKDRGYVERHEVVGKDQGPIEVVVKGYIGISPDDWPDEDESEGNE